MGSLKSQIFGVPGKLHMWYILWKAGHSDLVLLGMTLSNKMHALMEL